MIKSSLARALTLGIALATAEGRAPHASPEAAVAAAAHDALVDVLGTRSEELDTWYEQALAAIGDSEAKTAGVKLGREAAAHMTRARASDDIAGALGKPYVAGDEPGNYRVTPPFDFVFAAGWEELPTFVTPRASAGI